MNERERERERERKTFPFLSAVMFTPIVTVWQQGEGGYDVTK